MSLQLRNMTRRQSQGLGPESLVSLNDPRSTAAEAYRTLRTNIQFSSLEKPVRTLLLTSPRPGEEKSIAVANLAITFAQMGSRVVLVDADLHRPCQHTLFGLPNEQGLTSALLNIANQTGPVSTATPLEFAAVPNLRIFTSGPLPPNPAELLSSTPMLALIDRLCNEADYVLFDAPPVLAVSDAAVLATRLDGTLLVLKVHRTSRDDAREAKEQLNKVHANLLGSVLSGANPTRSRYGY